MYKSRGKYEGDDFSSINTQEILDATDGLSQERRVGSRIDVEAKESNLRPGTVEGYKRWVEGMRAESLKRLKEVEAQLVVAERFAALPEEQRENTPLAERPLRVEYARELTEQLKQAVVRLENELGDVDRALLEEARKQV